MNIHEFQAKRLLAQHGVPVPRGDAVDSPDRVRAVVKDLGGTVVVKAQIHAGGRGKGKFRRKDGTAIDRPDGTGPLGGVVVVDGAQAAEEIVRRMLGNVLVTKQTGPEGREVRRVLIAEGVDIAREYYLALVLDRTERAAVFVASAEGGTEIEDVAASRPDAVFKVPVDPRTGFSPWIGRRIAYGLGVGRERVADTVRLAQALHETFEATDASLIEVNPLIETSDGRVMALDSKVTLDDSALYRHPDLQELRDTSEENPSEVEASKHGLNYIKLEGNVGCMVNGAGLAMATMDIIKHDGGSPANFLDVGGGATAEMVTNAFRILLGDSNVRAVLINIFGGIMRCDIVARGVVDATREAGVDMPVVVRLEGTNVEEGRRILLESGLRFDVAEGMRDAAQKVVAAAGSA